ncbi:hypothetical protein RHSIM_Rhsim07G0177500 [Rhododendron simsii]|uniref:Acetyl-CoA carboxylase BT domain-containing protein n=1 Tax=Rhododendron simsii TaxID=118357 RepID=A0A834LJN3_RHOSS|nr:hypothetical protein RHSIM_Rhsim07G0177500 [Rhododendron simsii]
MLHPFAFMDPSGSLNAYQQVRLYNFTTLIRFFAWGKGGRTYDSSVSHCFNLNEGIGCVEVLKGQLFVDRIVEKKLNSFLDYISSGFELNCMKASTSSAAMVSEYIGYLEKGQIPPKIDMVRGGPGSLRMNDSEVEAEIHTLRDGGLLMQASIFLLDGNSHVIYAEEEAAGTRLLIDGRTCLLQNDNDPSKLVAEVPCKLLRYLVSDGTLCGGQGYEDVYATSFTCFRNYSNQNF